MARRVMDEVGLRTVFHRHIGTWVESWDEIRRHLDMIDPGILGLCFDRGHWLCRLDRRRAGCVAWDGYAKGKGPAQS